MTGAVKGHYRKATGDPMTTENNRYRRSEVASSARDVLIDCLTSFAIHGDTAAEAADFILSPTSGLLVAVDHDG